MVIRLEKISRFAHYNGQVWQHYSEVDGTIDGNVSTGLRPDFHACSDNEVMIVHGPNRQNNLDQESDTGVVYRTLFRYRSRHRGERDLGICGSVRWWRSSHWKS